MTTLPVGQGSDDHVGAESPHVGAESSDPLAAALSVADFADLARTALSEELWDWLEGGAERERTLAGNRDAFASVAVLPRVLADVSSCDPACSLVRSPAALPVAVAPIAYQRLFHAEGELAVARAAADSGLPYTVSTLSSVPMEEIAATGATTWFQLYWLRDKGAVLDLVQRAEAIGSEALVLTVDVPVMGRRLRDMRHGFALPPTIRAANLDGGGMSRAHERVDGGSAVAAHTASAFAPSLTWHDVEWLRERTRLPLVLKGLSHPADALRAAELGAAAVVVSNHGGRQLDGAAPSAVALPAVVEAVQGAFGESCQVLVDSGIRGGADVLRALALGASGVLLGRPVLWGLAAGGQAGCARVLSLLGEEFRHAMALAGCPDLAAVARLRTTTMPCHCGGDHQ
ncbi:alpha-hydroxy acid oxidase [Streptomyces sparsogenes]|uniref:alpha-hydroxy acid oxidase n=1 Tax=Streptomyces sparsogenes TaxID=67365 RepID=UPI00340EE8A6